MRTTTPKGCIWHPSIQLTARPYHLQLPPRRSLGTSSPARRTQYSLSISTQQPFSWLKERTVQLVLQTNYPWGTAKSRSATTSPTWPIPSTIRTPRPKNTLTTSSANWRVPLGKHSKLSGA